MTAWKTAICLALICLIAEAPQPALSETQQQVDSRGPANNAARSLNQENINAGTDEIDVLTRQIAAKLLELKKLTVKYRLAAIKQDKLRPWRQFSYSEANAAATEGGLIDTMVQRYRFLNHPYVVAGKTRVIRNNSALATEQTLEPQLVGQSIGIAGDMFEILLNVRRQAQIKREGLDSQTVRRKVNELAGEIDTLNYRRQQLVEARNLPSSKRSVYVAEGQLLSDIRDLSHLEFARYYSASKRFKTFQNSAYVLDIARNGLGSAGLIIGLYAADNRLPRMTGPAALFTMLSGSFVILTPIVSRMLAGAVNARAKRDVGTETAGLHTTEERLFHHHREFFEHTVAELPEDERASMIGPISRAPLYVRQSRVLDRINSLGVKEQQAEYGVAFESVATGIITGGTKISSGICGMVAGWRDYQKPILASRLVAAGNTSYACGTAITILENIRLRGAQEIAEHQHKSRHELPSQILEERLQEIDKIQEYLGVP